MRDNRPRPLQRPRLIDGCALPTANDRARVPHPPPRRRRRARDERHDRLRVFARLVELLEVRRGVFLHGAADLADEDDTLCGGVLEEHFDDVDVLGSAGTL